MNLFAKSEFIKYFYEAPDIIREASYCIPVSVEHQGSIKHLSVRLAHAGPGGRQ